MIPLQCGLQAFCHLFFFYFSASIVGLNVAMLLTPVIFQANKAHRNMQGVFC